MHRDVKLGLALGMLVIGFAAAFCFPRQPPAPHRAESQGSRVRGVGSDYELIPIRAYEAEHSTPPEVKQPPLQPAEVSLVSPARHTPLPSSSEPKSSEPLPTLAGPSKSGPLKPTAQTAINSPVIPEVRPLPDQKPTDTAKRYVVEPGDTLSSIAYRFLGTATKFQEIYQANSDVLSSPDALRPGMELRIPPATPAIVDEQPGKKPSTMAPLQRPDSLLFSTSPAGQLSQDPPGTFH